MENEKPILRLAGVFDPTKSERTNVVDRQWPSLLGATFACEGEPNRLQQMRPSRVHGASETLLCARRHLAAAARLARGRLSIELSTWVLSAGPPLCARGRLIHRTVDAVFGQVS